MTAGELIQFLSRLNPNVNTDVIEENIMVEHSDDDLRVILIPPDKHGSLVLGSREIRQDREYPCQLELKRSIP